MSNIRRVYAHGKWIDVETMATGGADPLNGVSVDKSPRRKPFVGDYAKLYKYWTDQLRHAEGMATYHLAHAILHEAFKRQYIRGPIVLSTAMTELAPSSRRRATKDMLRLRLIKVERKGRCAAVVTELRIGNGKVIRLEE